MSRLVRLSVTDQHGAPLPGAVLRITLAGQPLGLVQTGEGVASVEVDADGTLDVTAAFAGQAAAVRLPPGRDAHVFSFEASGLVRSKAPAQARCPDGSSGSPCITCRDGARTWRICA